MKAAALVALALIATATYAVDPPPPAPAPSNWGAWEAQRQPTTQQEPQKPPKRVVDSVCGPEYGSVTMRERKCTRTFDDGSQREVTCQREVQSGATECY